MIAGDRLQHLRNNRVRALGILLTSFPLLACTPEPPTPVVKQTLRQLGFFEVVPPSRLYAPGTLNTVVVRPDGSLEMHRTCEINQSALDFVLNSPTERSDIFKSSVSGIDASGQLETRINAAAGYKEGAKIGLKFYNVSGK